MSVAQNFLVCLNRHQLELLAVLKQLRYGLLDAGLSRYNMANPYAHEEVANGVLKRKTRAHNLLNGLLTTWRLDC